MRRNSRSRGGRPPYSQSFSIAIQDAEGYSDELGCAEGIIQNIRTQLLRYLSMTDYTCLCAHFPSASLQPPSILILLLLPNPQCVSGVPKHADLCAHLERTAALEPLHRLCSRFSINMPLVYRAERSDNAMKEHGPLYVLGTTFLVSGMLWSVHHVNLKSFVVCSFPVATSTTFACTPTCCPTPAGHQLADPRTRRGYARSGRGTARSSSCGGCDSLAGGWTR